ncbi:MAG: XRE family transcriptional regulator [Steroidobacteraceae bacterium]|jgi:transcriptional regulator with XRE-family HTH domain
MNTMNDWVNSTPERQRLFAEERLIALVTEEIYEAMNRGKTVSKTDLASTLGKSKAFVSQLLNGSRNMTLRTLAGIAHSLHAVVEIHLRDKHVHENWQPLSGAIAMQLRSPLDVRFECMNDNVAEAEADAKAA